MLSVHKNVFDEGMIRALMISSFKRITSNAAYSSSFGMEGPFLGATLAFPKTKKTCTSSEVFTRARRKATAQKSYGSFFLQKANRVPAKKFWSWYQRIARVPHISFGIGRYETYEVKTEDTKLKTVRCVIG